MNPVLFNITFFMLLMLIIFFVDYKFILLRKIKSKKVKNEEIMEFNYLIHKFNLDPKKINYRPTAMWCALFNGFIISGVVTVMYLIKLKFVWQLMIAFVMLVGLIYSIYEIYGRILVKKGKGKNNE